MKTLLFDKVVPLLLVIGGLILGLGELFDFHPVTDVLGTSGTSVVYLIIGAAALVGLYRFVDDTMHHGTTH